MRNSNNKYPIPQTKKEILDQVSSFIWDENAPHLHEWKDTEPYFAWLVAGEIPEHLDKLASAIILLDTIAYPYNYDADFDWRLKLPHPSHDKFDKLYNWVEIRLKNWVDDSDKILIVVNPEESEKYLNKLKEVYKYDNVEVYI